MLAYVYDETLQKEANRQGRNYWEIYIREILDMLGARGQQLSLTDLEDSQKLNEIKTLILGHQSGAHLTPKIIDRLTRWTQEGGILIGFAPKGLDSVFGITPGSVLSQKPEDCTLTGYFDLRPHDITHEIHPFLSLDQKLLIFSDIQCVQADDTAIELGRLFDPSDRDLECPAILWRPYGKGYAGFFAFDVAKTVWLLHQGRPLDPPAEGSAHQGSKDMQIMGANSRKIPYADEICFVLQNMLAQNPQPFIHQIPPENGRVPDALLYYGGDEYQGPTELSLKASDWMKDKGLGYHINMEERHPATAQEVKHILDNDHEVSMYYDLLRDGKVLPMEENIYLDLAEQFFKKFGFRPCVTVNHWLRWRGWAQPAKWMLKAGGKADNSFTATPIPSDHPLMNGPVYGFGQGTGFPFFFYDDATGQNQRIPFMEQPIICYETGHRGSVQDYRTDASEEVHLPVDMALKYHMVMNFFYHPNCVANFPLCQKAIEEILRYIDYRGAFVLHWGNDRVAKWWESRQRANVQATAQDDHKISIACECDWPSGMVIKMLLKRPIDRVTLEGPAGWRPATFEIKNEFAGNWLYVIVPPGKYTVSVYFEWRVFVHSVLHKKKKTS